MTRTKILHAYDMVTGISYIGEPSSEFGNRHERKNERGETTGELFLRYIRNYITTPTLDLAQSTNYATKIRDLYRKKSRIESALPINLEAVVIGTHIILPG